MAMKSRYEAYAKGIIAKRDSKIAKGSGTKTSVLASSKKRRNRKQKLFLCFRSL